MSAMSLLESGLTGCRIQLDAWAFDSSPSEFSGDSLCPTVVQHSSRRSGLKTLAVAVTPKKQIPCSGGSQHLVTNSEKMKFGERCRISSISSSFVARGSASGACAPAVTDERSGVSFTNFRVAVRLDEPEEDAHVRQCREDVQERDQRQHRQQQWEHQRKHEERAASVEELEKWLHGAVFEIVRNLKEAPFLHLVFNGTGNSTRGPTARFPISEENLLHSPADTWAGISSGFLKDQAPDGIILVHRLTIVDVARCYGKEFVGTMTASPPPCRDSHLSGRPDPSEHQSCRRSHVSSSSLARSSSVSDLPLPVPSGDTSQASIPGSLGASALHHPMLPSSSSSDVWGLVVQGRRSSRHVCYILKTTAVHSVGGLCTRFTLTRARCFGPELHQQLENAWLAS
eukprot:TRINITY_DN15890_c0_g1_i1.p1 TRINITY_DN15890_c0_g1~~TRINITY_DN15890_c0_g1_i1.p1  ORF type:complete len:399 (+),score=27.90 TRINITY_DN15890_c0_g1_i1:297-1493(+)